MKCIEQLLVSSEALQEAFVNLVDSYGIEWVTYLDVSVSSNNRYAVDFSYTKEQAKDGKLIDELINKFRFEQDDDKIIFEIKKIAFKNKFEEEIK